MVLDKGVRVKNINLADLLLVVITVAISAVLAYVSINNIRYSYYFYIHWISAFGFLAAAMFYFKQNGFVKERWGSSALILIYMIMVAVFLFYKTHRLQWIQIDKVSSLLLLAPILTLIHRVYKSKINVMDAEKAKKGILNGLTGLTLWGAIIYSVYYAYFSTNTQNVKFSSLSPTQQLVELSPWESYDAKHFLTFDKKGGYEIQEDDSSGSETKTIGVGAWIFTPANKTLTLNSGGIEETFQLSLSSDFAYLGTNPIEDTKLGRLWMSIVPDKVDIDSN